jgi:hypothetical protein
MHENRFSKCCFFYGSFLLAGAENERDAKNMRFTKSEEANKCLKPFTRKGGELKV